MSDPNPLNPDPGAGATGDQEPASVNAKKARVKRDPDAELHVSGEAPPAEDDELQIGGASLPLFGAGAGRRVL